MSEGDILLFGDESHSQEIVTYAFVIVPEERLLAVSESLERVKTRHRVRLGARIHCRDIFNAHARLKTDFSGLSTEELFAFLRESMAEAFAAGARGWVGYLDSRTAPDVMFFESDRATGIESWDVRDLKTRMLFCYQAASVPLTHIFPPRRVKAYVDGDRTKVPHFGKKRQVDGLRSFFPVEHNNAKFHPEVVHDNKPPLLDLADLLAYAAARGLAKTVTSAKAAFVSIVEALDPGYSEVVFELHAGGPMCKVRAYDPQDRVKHYIRQFL